MSFARPPGTATPTSNGAVVQVVHGESGWRRCARPLIVGIALVLSMPGTVPAAAEPAPEVAPVRVLLVGDSVTHGSSGDWTWRYRLWQHLSATSSVPVDLVGPRDDLHDYRTDENGNHDYIDPGFDRDHAARWGMTLAFADAPIDDLVETYEPDVVVEMLGTNDLLFLTHSPERVDADLESFVAAARSADPDVDIVLSEVTQTWFPGAPELNDLLAASAYSLDDESSRVLLADTDADYTRSEDTFDGSHPNARGEVTVAAAVGDSLAELGVGEPAVRPLATPPLGPRIPVDLSGSLVDRVVGLTWTPSPGATTYRVSQRDRTTGEGWQVVADEVAGTTWSAPVPAGHRVELRVLPRKGWQLAQDDVSSAVFSADVPPHVPGRPARPTARVRPSGVVRVDWPDVPAATGYRVELRRLGRRWRPAATPVRSTAVLRGLRPGARYDVRVTAVNAGGAGRVSRPVRVKIREHGGG